MGKNVIIGGRIHNPEVGNVAVGANEVLDDTKVKKQNVINAETDAELLRLENEKQDNLTFDNTPTEDSVNPVTSGGVYAADAQLQMAIEAILLLIPSAASALNQLADKSFVNSTVATATATFRGTYNVVTDLGLEFDATHEQIAAALLSHIATADNNDYAFVQIPVSATSTDIRVTERYKFNGTVWGYEYDLNNSGFTASQWAAINSTITQALVGKLSALPTAAELATLLAGKQNVLTFDNVPVSGSDNPVKSCGLYQLFAAIDAKFPSDASANNKLVAENRLAAYVTAVIEALDASFDLTSADNHVTFRMTQTNGVIASVQILTSDIASASALTTLGGHVSTNETDIANLQAAYAGLTQSDVIVGTLPSSGQQQNIIYRQPDQGHTPPQFYSDYMWNGTTWVLMATYNNAIDQRPTFGSLNLVESKGILSCIGDNCHILHLYTPLSNVEDYSSANKLYTLCRIPSDCFINSVIAEYPATVAENSRYFYLISADGTKVVRKSLLNIGKGAGNPVETEIRCKAEEGMYACLASFCFEVIPTETAGDSWIIDINGSVVTNITNGSKRFKMAAMLNISEEKKQVAENTNDIRNIYSSVAYDNLNPDNSSFTIYTSGSDFYSVCRLHKGEYIRSFEMFGANGYYPKVMFIKDDGTVIDSFNTRDACKGGDKMVTLPVEYLVKEDCQMFLSVFYYKVDIEGEFVTIYTVGTGFSDGTAKLKYNLKVNIESPADLQKVSIPYSDLSMVETFGVCGDSYAAGMIAVEPPYYPETTTITRPNLSWGKVLERHYGIDVTLFADGGVTVKGYLTNQNCLPALLSDSAKKLYAISLGHNDMYAGTTVGDISSLDGDWENYPDNFIGNYGRIIEQLIDHAPNAKIILLRQTKPYATMNNGAALNQTISDLGTHYNLPVFDPEEDPYLSSYIWVNTMIRNHPVFSGYAGLAMAFARMFEKATVKYWNYFNLFGIN